MKKTCIIIIAFFLLPSLVFAKSKSASNSFESYLKNPAYIASIGRGETAAVAEQNALERISKYFSMQISVKSTENTVSDDSGTRSVLTDESFVKSETELFAVHYEKPIYDKKQKFYETIAWIDRAEAWEIYEPQISKTISAFENLCISANAESEPLKKAVLFSVAKNHAEENDIERKIDFAIALYPESSNTFFNASAFLSELPSRILSAASKCTVAIECDFEDEGVVKSAIASALQKFKIKASDNPENAQYICTVRIEENFQTLQAGNFYAPSYEVEFLNGTNVILSCAGNVKRTGAKSAEVAKTRAYKALASDISENLTKTLNGKN